MFNHDSARTGRLLKSTLLPTPNPSLSPIPTPTPLPQGFSLSFKIKFQGVRTQRGDKQVRVTLKNGQVLNSVLVTSDSQGVYSGSINSITPGTYEVLVKGFSHLQKNFGSVTFVAGQTVTKDFSGTILLAGDANGDNRVDSGDFDRLASDYLPRNPPNSPADFNLDGRVDSTDFDLLAGNYLKTGDPL